jgi:hypothetical protein
MPHLQEDAGLASRNSIAPYCRLRSTFTQNTSGACLLDHVVLNKRRAQHSYDDTTASNGVYAVADDAAHASPRKYNTTIHTLAYVI